MAEFTETSSRQMIIGLLPEWCRNALYPQCHWRLTRYLHKSQQKELSEDISWNNLDFLFIMDTWQKDYGLNLLSLWHVYCLKTIVLCPFDLKVLAVANIYVYNYKVVPDYPTNFLSAEGHRSSWSLYNLYFVSKRLQETKSFRVG